MTEPVGRVYGGRSEAERRADRRDRLIQTGLELFGTEGWHPVTIERLCAGASVATRSFYEEFPSREALLQAAYDEVVRTASVAVVAAMGHLPPDTAGRDAATRASALRERIDVGVSAYLRHVTEDPRRARIAYREVRVVGSLEQHRHETMVGFAEQMAADLCPSGLPEEPARRRARTLALAGAISEVLVDWVAMPEPRPPLEPLRAELCRLFTVALVPSGSS